MLRPLLSLNFRSILFFYTRIKSHSTLISTRQSLTSNIWCSADAASNIIRILGLEYETSPFSLPSKGHHNPFFISLYTPTQPGQTWCCSGMSVSHKRNSFAKEAPQIIAWGIKKRDLDPNSDLDVNTLWSKILELKIITAYCKHCCFKNKSGWLEPFPWKHFQIQNGSWIQYNFGKMLGF